MSHGIVDHLEPVEVEEHHRQDARSAIETVKRVLQPVHQDRPVRNPRERVRRCPLPQQDVCLLALRDVADRSHDEALAGRIDDVICRFDPEIGAIAATEPVRHRVDAVADEAQIPGCAHGLNVVGMRELFLVPTPELVRIPAEQSAGRRRDVAIDPLGRGDGDHVRGGSRQRFDVVEFVLVSLHEIPGFVRWPDSGAAHFAAMCWGRTSLSQTVALRIHEHDRRYDLLPGRTGTRARAPIKTLLNRTSTRARWLPSSRPVLGRRGWEPSPGHTSRYAPNGSAPQSPRCRSAARIGASENQLVRIPSGRASSSEPALRARGASPRSVGRGTRGGGSAPHGPASELRGVGPRGRSGSGCPRTWDLAQRDERTPEVLRGDVPAARHEGNEQTEHLSGRARRAADYAATFTIASTYRSTAADGRDPLGSSTTKAAASGCQWSCQRVTLPG